MKKVTVVIPNWNGIKYIRVCLDSLRKQDTDDFAVLVIDNASEDGSDKVIEEEYPEAELHRMPENLGFAGGVNEGIRLSKTPYVLLLNNDIEAEPAFVRALTEAIERDERIFSVSARMVNYRERNLLDDTGDLYTVLGWGAQRGVGQSTEDPRYLKPCRVFSACGGAAIYRKSVLDEIGAFDPDHFAYLEDIDLGYRAQIYGYRNMYEPGAVVYHWGSGSSGAVKYSDFKVRISARNNIYLCYKNMPLFFRGINALPLLIGRTLKRRFFKKEGFLEAYDEGIREGYEKRKGTRKVPFSWKHLGYYLSIEAQLIGNTFVYIYEYSKRH
ncbi:MAG: glycosyltransferase family 2 protein [Lachnospiraceae bacterium]|nr:glycosyltransferase family 2 protein [Lachnospiraceae bacterium]